MIAKPRADPVARYLFHRIAERALPGASWWIGHGNDVASSGAIGDAELEPERRPVTAATPYDLASLTKPLCTALLLALLDSRGTVDTRERVSAFLPELRGAEFGARTLLDLACHTAGLAAWRPLCARAEELGGYLHRIAAEGEAAPPGRALYSDLGYIVLGAILERAAGETLDRLFRNMIAGPLGLERIGFAPGGAGFADAAATEWGNRYERELAGEEAAGYSWREEPLRGQVHDANAHGIGGVAGHAGLFGTAGDVAAIGREILAPSRLDLSAPARDRLLRPIVDGRTAGFVTASHSRAARGILPDAAPGHTGFTGTSLWLLPDDCGVLVLLTNRIHPYVGSRDFQLVRRGFHRVARRAHPRNSL